MLEQVLSGYETAAAVWSAAFRASVIPDGASAIPGALRV